MESSHIVESIALHSVQEIARLSNCGQSNTKAFKTYSGILINCDWSAFTFETLKIVGSTLFSTIKQFDGSKSELSVFVSLLCQVYPYLPSCLQEKFYGESFSSLQSKSGFDSERLTALVAVSILSEAVQYNVCADQSSLCTVIVFVLSNSTDETCALVLDLLFVQIHKSFDASTVQELIKQVLENIQNHNSEVDCTEKFLFTLCGLLPFIDMCHLNDESHAIVNMKVWRMIQSGFHHDSRLCRKRSMFILKSILEAVQNGSNDLIIKPVFTWKLDCKEEILEAWNQYFLVMESLEEKQVGEIEK